VSDLWLIRTWRKSYPVSRTHLLDGEAFATSSSQQAGLAARIRFEFVFTTENEDKESKVEAAITPTPIRRRRRDWSMLRETRVYLARLGKLQGGPKRPVLHVHRPQCHPQSLVAM